MSIFDDINNGLGVTGEFEQLTLGEVVDTNDPQQMGRIRIACPYFGDTKDTPIKTIPWATPISPLAGTTTSLARGREDNISSGPVAYGMFNVPKVGTYVLVACIEGDPKFRVYLGCLHDQFLPHTLPHGRYSYNKENGLQDEPSGPLTSTEEALQPLYDSQTMAFQKSLDSVGSGIPIDPRKNYEYRTRGADIGVAGIDSFFIDTDDVLFTSHIDDKAETFTEKDGNEIENTHGYHKTRLEDGLTSDTTVFAYDPQVYSWTTPGFHSISMGDSAKSCRIRVRTTQGHQIILDDTNERIYLSVAGGKSWIELDEKTGNIDIYAKGNISYHAEKDINFTAGDTFRVKAKNGIHLISETEVRLHAKSGNLQLKSDSDLNILATNIHLTGSSETNITGGVLKLASDGDANINAGGQILQTGSAIHLNGPPAAAATPASASNTKEAFWTNRVPEHEPWARVMTKVSATDNSTGNTHTNSAEFTYDDPNVGKSERGELIDRNPNWHR